MSETRTIYAWTPGASQSHDLIAENQISPLVMQYQHGLIIDHTDITPHDAPNSLKMYRPMSTDGFGQLFFDCRYTGKSDRELDFGDVLNVSGTVLVSEVMRDRIRTVDPAGQHEFVPTLIFDGGGNKISTKDYFHFWCGRRVYSTALSPDFKYQTTLRPSDSYSFIFREHAASLVLASLPIWMYQADASYFFMNSDTYAALRKSGLEGLGEFTKPGGRYRKLADGTELNRVENVGHIRIPVN